MKMVSRVATAGAVAAVSLGLGAASAAAYSVSGGSYVGQATADHTFTVAGMYTITCPAAGITFTGTATGAASSSFTPHWGSNCNFFGLPASVTQSGQWTETVTSGPIGGVYGADFHIPSTATTTLEVPLAGCTVTITGTQSFSNGSGGTSTTTRNVAGGAEAGIRVEGLAYAASGCPFSSGTDGTYSSNGNISIPGITVS